MMIVGIDHGYYAIKTKHVSFPSGIIKYDYEPYTMQNVLQYRGKYYVLPEHTGISPMLSDVPGFSGWDGTNIPDVSFRPHLLYNPFISGSVRMDVLDKNRAANRVLCGHVAF